MRIVENDRRMVDHLDQVVDNALGHGLKPATYHIEMTVSEYYHLPGHLRDWILTTGYRGYRVAVRWWLPRCHHADFPWARTYEPEGGKSS